ncbi:MAG: hypothetical protein ACJA2E_000467 [Arenicella sp.]|jgi:hypothetical protein
MLTKILKKNLLNSTKIDAADRRMVFASVITCREFNDFIFDDTDGLLTEKQPKLLKRHMQVCPMCRIFLNTYIAAYKATDHSFADSDLNGLSTVPQDLLNVIAAVLDDRISTQI